MTNLDPSLETKDTTLHEELVALELRRDELRAERDKFRDLYEWAPDMSASLNVANGTIIECNSHMQLELRYNREELLGSSILTMSLATGQRYTVLSEEAESWDPSLSPDGTTIAFASALLHTIGVA